MIRLFVVLFIFALAEACGLDIRGGLDVDIVGYEYIRISAFPIIILCVS